MIFEEIVQEVCERLNLSSDDAKARVGREVNNRYRRVTSTIGLSTSRHTQVSKAATVGSQSLTFTGVEEIFNVIDKTNTKAPVILKEITPDEMIMTVIRKQPPRKYAITDRNPTSVTILMDCTPAAPVFTLYADGLVTVQTLSGSDKPNFPESFHDILIFGAMADEYRKLEKLPFYRDCETDYERRLSDLRMFLAKSAYLDITQGHYSSKSSTWTRQPSLTWNQ